MLGDRIREIRQSRGMSQVELGKRNGVSKQSISNWEDENIQPSIDILIRIAKFFSVTTEYLLSLDTRNFQFRSVCRKIYKLYSKVSYHCIHSPDYPFPQDM